VIVSNNSRMFGLSHVGVVKSPTFSCVACTAPDGMFKGCSTIFQAFDGDEWNHSKNLVLVARALLHPTLSKKARALVHRTFVDQLDVCGLKGYDLAKAIDEVFEMGRVGGAIVDSINKSHELWTSDAAKANRASVLHKFDFGTYRLHDTITDFAGLVEFSSLEYAAIRRKFKGEKIYNAPPINFLGRSWQLMLSIVNGRIWKIAVLISRSNEQEATPIAIQAHQYCEQLLGSPSEEKSGLSVWDTKGGNVVMQTTQGVHGPLIAVFLTSASIQQFDLL
jgi:hypothetical protein